jgi:hypothetical protein
MIKIVLACGEALIFRGPLLFIFAYNSKRKCLRMLLKPSI